MFISYAQNFEDIILYRALKHVGAGFYIDIGAQDDTVDSVSRGFYEHGWRGVHVEPVPEYARQLRERRDGETVLEQAVSATRGRLPFFVIAGTGISTGDMTIAQQHRAAGFDVQLIEVESVPLSDVLARYEARDVHWLKIDVEGMEQQVIESWPPSPVRPWIVVVESTLPGSPQPSHQPWEPTLFALGYDYVYFDGVNRYYVSQAHPGLKASFGPGPNYFDGFAISSSNWMNRLGADRLQAAAQEIDLSRALLAQAHSRSEQLQGALQQEKAAHSAKISDQSRELARASDLLAKQDAQITAHRADVSARSLEIARLSGVAAQLAKSEAAVARLTREAAQQRAESAAGLAQAKDDLTAARIALAGLQKDLDVQTAQAARLGLEVTRACAEAAHHKAAAATEQSRSMREFERGEYFRRKLDELAVTATNQERLIGALQSSTSWRITAPLRGVANTAARLAARPRAALTSLLERALIAHRKRPVLATAVRAGASLVPPLNRRLRQFASQRLPPSHHTSGTSSARPYTAPPWAKAQLASNAAIPSSPLTLRARAIADELERARNT